MNTISKNSAAPFKLVRSADQERNIKMLHKLLPKLSDEKLLAVYFRIWECLTIEEIARIIGRSWEQADQLIEEALRELRNNFAEQTFSIEELIAA